MIRLALNGTALMAPLTGIGHYTLQLARALQQQEGIEVELFYATHFSRDIKTGAPPAVGKLRQWVRRHIPNSYGISRGMQQFYFTRGARAGRYDLYHEPNFLAYRFEGPSVITVHDLSWIRYPETHPVERVQAMDRFFEPGLRRASLLVTDSDFVKQEVMDVFGVPADRIVTVPLGLDEAFRPMAAAEAEPVMQRHGLRHGAYFLSVGTFEPRKNIERTVAAYASLPPAVREAHPLVMAGMRGWRTSSLEAALAPLVAGGQVRVLGYLEREELAAITAGALALVYPSLYEGFGLPPLEAMGCGVPAIASATTSLPEVVGDSGLLVQPLDVDAIRGAMAQMAGDPGLRARLSTLALERSKQFTWAGCGAATAAAYRLALGRPS